ncbi:hypothetical protein ZPR_2504 [Zunongwangia profunda SM-A87]|uniref:Uncharacterized protein n=1 Tax=Zunongwangia profunda (strain DSM 18752 / CCTCC AB 206139 / SM-A87) TaxID=655815 RepID=D5BE69_ZUNPS|nr:hypothetical protein ZPR_2504 [Zunongwangia profunda SM-A87]
MIIRFLEPSILISWPIYNTAELSFIKKMGKKEMELF